MNICIICNVEDLWNSNLKDQVTVEERAIVVDEDVHDIAMDVVEEGEILVDDPSKPAEDPTIIVSQLIEIMNRYIVFNLEVVLNSNLKEQVTVEERAIVVDEAVIDVALPVVEVEETIVVDAPKPAEEPAVIVSSWIRNMNICTICNAADLLN